MRYYFYLLSQNKFAPYNDLNDIAETIIEIYKNLNIPIIRKDKVVLKIRSLVKDYDNTVAKNVSKSHIHSDFVLTLKEPFDVQPTEIRVNPSSTDRSLTNQHDQFETVSWDDYVISSSDEEEDEIEFDCNELMDCALALSRVDDEDPDFEPRSSENIKRKIKKTILSDNLCATIDRIKISSNAAFRLMATVLDELCIDLSEVVFSVSTLNRYRRSNREKQVEHLKETLVFPEQLTLH